MKYHLTIDEAQILESLKAIKADPARPVLGLLKMTFKGIFTDPGPKGDREFGTIQIAKTDSYVLAVWHLDVPVEGETGNEFWNDTGLTVYPIGSELAAAVKILREQAKPFAPNMAKVTLEPYVDDRDGSPTKDQVFIDVSGAWNDAMTITVQATDGKVGSFPNVDKLVHGSMDANEREDRRSLTVDGVLTSLPMEEGKPPVEVAILKEPVELRLPALDAEKLATIFKLLGATASQRKRFGPALMTHNTSNGEVEGFELKPPVFCVSSHNRANRLTYVLMPVRT